MGLTTWKKAPDGRVQKSDTIVAKNYLSDSELSQLNLITTAFLDMAESRAARHIVSTMDDWKKFLQQYLATMDYEPCDTAGKVTQDPRGVTGFVGPGSKPVPLTEEEMLPLGIKKEEIQVDFAEGDTVVVTGGAWKDTVGVITALNVQKQTATINVELFGRETPVEISFAEIKQM